jgi:hypothetical protein
MRHAATSTGLIAGVEVLGPLRPEDDLDEVLAGESWDEVREDVVVHHPEGGVQRVAQPHGTGVGLAAAVIDKEVAGEVGTVDTRSAGRCGDGAR